MGTVGLAGATDGASDAGLVFKHSGGLVDDGLELLAAKGAGRVEDVAPAAVRVAEGQSASTVAGGEAVEHVSAEIVDIAPQPKTPKALYRAMTGAGDSPATGSTARELGARMGTDIVVDAEGMVHPNTGRMSTSTSPGALPSYRRPPAFGGTGKDPLWSILTDALPPSLKATLDKSNPTQVFIEPAESMSFEDYQRALWDTLSSWEKQ